MKYLKRIILFRLKRLECFLTDHDEVRTLIHKSKFHWPIFKQRFECSRWGNVRIPSGMVYIKGYFGDEKTGKKGEPNGQKKI